ncbi:DUF1801 domain-containing protein [Pyxidicoccus xibeiensis]|uniref:DUF1801 domain-containing protein n=1 Tax=Pyxidicoccus xibeiensis TaxID=2906759 RepID=UPI0020A7D2DA|nr:DUF1801 domain-containing protein [Pyxidicoccus xibeiensis]MCP3140296.1 DUF1801 domain-containing protein [Pyxidicoccus xibeiensis]
MATPKSAASRKSATKQAAPKKAAAKKAAAKKAVATKAAQAVPKLSPSAVVPKALAAKGASIEGFIAALEGWQQAIVRPLAALIAKEAPEAAAYVKWGHPVWDVGGPFALVKPAKGHVTLGFWRGGQLSDADGILEGEGAGMRYVRIPQGGALPASLAALVREAVALNERHGDPLKR